jgi:hypothetical protein
MNLIERFSKYNDDGLRDGNFGEGSLFGSNGRSVQKDACSGKNADELTNWDGTKKNGLGW